MRTRTLATLAALLISLDSFAAPPAIDRTALDEAFDRLPRYEYGEDRAPLAPIERAVAAAGKDRRLRTDLEKRFIRVLRGKATKAAKDFACRQASLVVTDKAAPALAGLLPDEDLSGLARYGLERIPGAGVERALRDALPRVSGKNKIGVISSLGVRGDRKAVRPLTALLDDPNEAVAAAAALALGNIASPDAARALIKFRAAARPALRVAADDACLEAARRLARRGDRRLAAGIYEDFFSQGGSDHLRMAGLQGLVEARPSEANKLLLNALRGSDAALRNLAAGIISQWPAKETPKTIIGALPELPADGQVALLAALHARADATVRPAVLALTDCRESRVRVAALETLGVVGNAADVPTLARRAATGPREESKAARNSLETLGGKGVDEAIAAALPTASPETRVELLRSLSARGSASGADDVARYLGDADAQVRSAAAATLGAVGDERQVPVLIRHLVGAKGDSSREELVVALQSIASRVKAKASDSVLAGLRQAGGDTRIALLRVLPVIGGERALEALRAAARDPNAEVRNAAVRALTDWPEVAAAPDLLQIIRSSDITSHRVLAFRGYVRLARESDAAAEAKLKMLAEALGLAQTADDKKLVVGALGEVPTVESLRIAAQQLTEEGLTDEAGAAAVRIAAKLEAKDKAEVEPVLKQVLESVKAESVLQDARKQMKRLGIKAGAANR